MIAPLMRELYIDMVHVCGTQLFVLVLKMAGSKAETFFQVTVRLGFNALSLVMFAMKFACPLI